MTARRASSVTARVAGVLRDATVPVPLAAIKTVHPAATARRIPEAPGAISAVMTVVTGAIMTTGASPPRPCRISS